MSDLKQLFHAPEVLSDADLVSIRRKLRLQHYAPFYCAAFAGFGTYVIDEAVLRRRYSLGRAGPAAVAGFFIGAYGVMNFAKSIPRDIDRDIILAHDKRYLQKAINASGLGDAYVSAGHNEDYMPNKPF